MKYTFIVPFYNHWDLTMRRLVEFRQFLSQECEILLVDDASTDSDVKSGIAFWQKSGIALHKILYTRNSENLGFPGSMNRGASLATGDAFVFYSNDVILRGDVSKALDGTLNDNVLVGNRAIDWLAGWNEFDTPKGKRIVPYLEGWFIACTRKSWEGKLSWDEIYKPSDYEDVDLSMQALQLGYNLTSLNTGMLQHIGSQSFMSGADREARTRRNRDKFIEKWKSVLME